MKIKLKSISLVKIVSILFAVVFFNILINTIFFNKTTTLDFSTWVMILGMVTAFITIFLAFYLSRRFVNIYNFFEKYVKKHKYLIMLSIFLLQLFIIGLAYKNCGFDCGYVIVHAYKLLKGEIEDGIFDISYFSNYTNNLALLYIFKYIFQIMHCFFEVTEDNIFLITAVVNIVMIDLAEIIMLNISKKLFGTKVTILVFMLSVPLIIFNPYIIVAYSDTLSMFIPLLIFYLYLKIKEWHKTRYIYIFLEGLVMICGYYIKPTILIMAVAIIASEMLFFSFKGIKKNISKKLVMDCCISLVILLSSIIMTMGIISWFKSNKLEKLIPDWIIELNSVPPTHFFMMGLNTQEQPGLGKNKIVYGSYYTPDVFGTLALKGRGNKIQYNLKVIEQRLKDYKFTGYMDFLYKKMNWIACDGTFYYGQEGGFYNCDFLNKSTGARKIQKFFDVNSDFYKKYVANGMQIIWVVILVGLVISYKDRNKNTTILKLSIIGIIMFILLFEGRSRYLYSYIPIFIMVSALGIRNITNIGKKLFLSKS